MSLGFRNTNVYQMSTENFSGIDLRNKNRSHLMSNAVKAENVFINDEGEVEKRTGFKSLFETDEDEKLNGAYLYKYSATKQFYIIHIENCLYETDENFSYKKLIYSSISNSPSKGFVFGDGFYIMCEGYYKISYLEAFESLGVCKICDAYRKYSGDSQIIARGRSKNSFDGDFEVINFEYGKHKINYKNDTYYFDSVNSNYDKLYIARKEAWGKIRICNLYMGTEKIKAYHYLVEKDNFGIYVKLRRRNNGVLEYYRCEPSVEIIITDFVYAPKHIVSRTPVGVSDIDGDVLEGFSNAQIYNGIYTEDLNLAATNRKINFFVDFSLYTSCAYLRFYLNSESCEGKVLSVKAGGDVLHCYVEQEGAYDTVDIVYHYGNKFVDIKKSLLKEKSGGGDITVEIEYCNFTECNDINECDVFGFYGGSNDTRVFLSGNKNKSSCDFESGCFEGSYFPALSYTRIGNDCSKILGYGRYYSYQLIFKDGIGDAQMYFRMYNEESGYKILKGNMSVSAVSKDAIININSKLFVLSSDGLYTIEQTAVEGECKCVMRSYEINGILKKENFENLFLAEVYGMLMICGGDKIYVLDILKNYNWYIFTTPKKFFRVEKTFGDAFLHDKGIMRFADKDEDGAYFDEDEPVCAIWQTNFVCFSPEDKRDILSAYCCLSECESVRSGAEILYSCDDYDFKSAVLRDRDLFSFDELDFSRFSFWCVRNGRSIKTHLRSKRVEKFCLSIRNAKGEPFKINKIGFLYR